MRADRLLSVLLLLQTRGRITAQELAERLEVSERTIYRDLDALSIAGIPVYGEHGPGGGYALLDSYRTNLTGLTESQIRTLLLSGTVGPLADLGIAKELEAALLKLLATLPESQRDRAEHTRIRLHLDPAWWFQPSEEVPHLRVIQQAIWNDCRTRIVYHKADGTIRERLIEPYGLVAKANIWYVVASIGEEMRVYRVSRIESVEVLDECFLRPTGFDLAAYWTEWCREFEATRPRYEIKLRISPELAQRLPGLWGVGIRKRIEAAQPDADGWRIIPVVFDTQEWAATSILMLGKEAEIVEPSELKAEIMHLARAILDLPAS